MNFLFFWEGGVLWGVQCSSNKGLRSNDTQRHSLWQEKLKEIKTPLLELNTLFAFIRSILVIELNSEIRVINKYVLFDQTNHKKSLFEF